MPATPDPVPGQRAPAPCRVALGFDYGRTRIGVAAGEAVTGSARPLRTLPARRQRPDWDAIGRLIQDWRPDLLVVGVPRHADGSAGTTTAAALRFGRQLEWRFHLPVATIDERLSSWEAEQRQATAAAGRRRDSLDARAAAIILESWFNQQGGHDPWATPNS
jgi:putative Holliday junction resolvase